MPMVIVMNDDGDVGGGGCYQFLRYSNFSSTQLNGTIRPVVASVVVDVVVAAAADDDDDYGNICKS